MNRTGYAWLLGAYLVIALICSAVTPPGGADTDTDTKAAVNDPKAVAERAWAVEVGHPTFVSPHASPIAVHGNDVFVANTPADTVDVIDATTGKVTTRIPVGVDPVSIAVRPDGKEVWVSNHVSDSVSVIANDPQSRMHHHVIATIQEFDTATKATQFDEPIGIAFASNEKAYIALSSENQIAVVDVATRKVRRKLFITAQDPRAIKVRGDRLYVIPFESNNQSQLSGGTGELDGDLHTFDAHQHSIAVNNVLSLGHVVDIVKNPKVPDRDLYVFDTTTDRQVQVVSTVGTLLYGLAVDSKGQVFVSQTDARNEINGRSGTKKHGLAELENRAFLNRITKVSFRDSDDADDADDGEDADDDDDSGDDNAAIEFMDLEPLPPNHPAEGKALATPFAIEISDDDSTLIATAAGSDKLFTVDAVSGDVLGRVDVGAVPRGIALENKEGRASRAWVLNAVENSVSLVDVSDPANPEVTQTVALEDPTHATVKRGRIAFNTASASTTGTFACASCHPDGHTDQLLWVLKTPIVTGGNQIMPRSTMPVRGLRDTAPFHWDGIPGDPYGGNNSGSVHRSAPPNSDVNDPASSTRHVIDGGLAATMARDGDPSVNDEGKPGKLTAAQRDDMAVFLLSVPYPPAQKRSYDNVVSERAARGFRLFHIDGDHDGKPRPNVCGDCHRMPFWVSTNTPGTGMDAPTWRGAYDRWLILPQGRLNIIDFDFFRNIAQYGIPERNMWQFSWAGRRRFDPVWNMVLEGSTGFSGSFARQVTLDSETVTDRLTSNLLDALELSAREGAVLLEAEGVWTEGDESKAISLQYRNDNNKGAYVDKQGRRRLTRKDLEALARKGKFVGTFTARHGVKADVDHPQPALWTLGPIERQRGRQRFPILHPGRKTMKVSGRHIDDDSVVFVDGRLTSGVIRFGEGEEVLIELAELPEEGMHLLQVQNANGLFSNDFIFHVAADGAEAIALDEQLDHEHSDYGGQLSRAIAAGNLAVAKRILNRPNPPVNRRQGDGSAPLLQAALHGQLPIAKLLLERGARVNATNNDGNTPLHVAAFLCDQKMVELLLAKGASATKKNRRGETPVDSVSGEWSDELAGFYTTIANLVGIKIDLKMIEETRPKIAEHLREHLKQ